MRKNNFDIIIRAIDQASPVFDRVSSNAQRYQKNIVRQAGDLGEVGGIKKIGKIFGDVDNANVKTDIRAQAEQARRQALAEYRKDAIEVQKLEELGVKNDNARIAAALFRAKLQEDEIARQRKLEKQFTAINSEEQRQLKSQSRFAGVSKVAGALGIAEVGGRALQAGGSRLSDIGQRAVEQNAGVGAIAGETARAIPGVGTLARGFDSVRDGVRDVVAGIANATGASKEWVFWLQSGESALKSANAEAAKIDAQIERRNKARDSAKSLADQQFGASDRPQDRINAINAEIEAIKKRNEAARNELITTHGGSRSKAGDQLSRLDKSEAVILDQRKRDIQKILDAETKAQDDAFNARMKAQRDYLDHLFKFNSDMVSISRDTKSQLDTILTNGLRESGDVQEATLREIQQRFESQRNAIRDEIAKTRNDSTLNDGEKQRKTGALQGQIDVTDTAQREAERQATRTAKDDRLSKLVGIEKEILGIRAQQGDISAGFDIKRIEVAERYKRLEEEITKSLGDRNLTEEQRNALLQQRESLKESLKRDLQDAGERVSVVQGQQRAGAVDGRFQTQSVAQNAQVEILRQSQQHAKTTSENTKRTADGVDTVKDLMKDLLSALTG